MILFHLSETTNLPKEPPSGFVTIYEHLLNIWKSTGAFITNYNNYLKNLKPDLLEKSRQNMQEINDGLQKIAPEIQKVVDNLTNLTRQAK